MTSRPSRGSHAQPRRGTPSQDDRIRGLAAIIMAAGLGKRMRSKVAKVLHTIAGRPLVLYAVDLAERVAGQGVAVVVGHQGDRVRAVIASRSKQKGSESVAIAEQAQQLGTGHAVMQARHAFMRERREAPSAYLILNGDTPLLAEGTLRRLWNLHQTERATVSILTALLEDPTGYGRVVRSDAVGREGQAKGKGPVVRIVEDRDATPSEAELREVNVGTYVVDARFLFEALDKLERKNARAEYYLTDLIGMAEERGLRVSALTLRDADEGLGINSRRELAVAEQITRRQINLQWLEAGVTLHDPMSTWIDADVTVGPDTVIYPHVALEGTTSIGEDCVIHAHVRLTDCVLHDRVLVRDCCVLREAELEEGAIVGPFAHLRPGAVVRKNAKVGNFVEMKETELGEGSKANHLSYLGNARIGRGVNIGAGTITCNYDGVRKQETVIEDDVFVGSNALLIAPVTVGRGSLIAAGSAVSEDVPADALAIGRATQVNRPGWATRRRAAHNAGLLPAKSKPKSKPAGKRARKKVRKRK